MPHFANDFRTVRRQLELMPSRVLPDGQLGPPPPPYFNTKGECSCSCSCGAREAEADRLNSMGLGVGPSEVALDAIPMQNMREMSEILAGPDSPSTAPSTPDIFNTTTYTFPTSNWSGSMGMLSSGYLSSEALATMNILSAPPKRPRLVSGFGRFRSGSSASLFSVLSGTD